MLDIGWTELMVVAVLTIIVVGPSELPRVLRTVMGVVRKIRMMASDFQSGIEDVAREADLEDIKKEMEKAQNQSMGENFEEMIDPTGDLDKSMKDMRSDFEKAKTPEAKTKSE